jgi:TPP-dependent pyruvate/acetoin dehydrogenase alpha subunit
MERILSRNRLHWRLLLVYSMTTTTDTLLKYYTLAQRIRIVEERIAAEYPKGEIRCPVHLSIGQEIVSAAVGMAQEVLDTAVSSHRAHAHYLAKGGDLYRMIAELFGRVTGCCKGRGGSMHLIDLSKGFLGSSAIVGNSIPVGVGAGFTHKLDRSGQLTFTFFGDGATEEGVFYESVNFAVVNKIPVVFLCENNLYSVYTDLTPRQPVPRKIHEMVSAMGLKSFEINSLDPLLCLQETLAHISWARENQMPIFLEYKTYRWLEHCGPNDDDGLGYRPNGELQDWKEKDPLTALRNSLLTNYLVKDTELDAIDAGIREELDLVFEKVRNDRFPTLVESMQDVYA